MSHITASESESDRQADYDLVIVGGTAGGLSVAVSSMRVGLRLIRVLESGHTVVFPELVGPDELDVGYGEEVSKIDFVGSRVVIRTNKRMYRAWACLIGERRPIPGWVPPVKAFESTRILIDELPDHCENLDVLIVGDNDHAVEFTALAAEAGARVVLAAGGMDPQRLSPAGDNMLRRLERERRVTLLYRSSPTQIVDTGGYPMVYFGDRRTPDLQFDFVVFVSDQRALTPTEVGLTRAALDSGRVWFLGEPEESSVKTTAPGWRIGVEIAAACFPDLDLDVPRTVIGPRRPDPLVVEELRSEHYNATITYFEPTHSDLWVLRVRPDHGSASFTPGEYASLGLGYWEPRIDDAVDPKLALRWDKLVRRSYSISSRIFDESGYLSDVGGLDELEFYIVLVPLSEDKVPSLTPRLAMKRPGDRIYLGPKLAGRYTLASVTEPAATVLFFATGTGEAPHNAMVIELLRKGHYGPIVSAVSVRRRADLAYLEKHQSLAERYRNYFYLPLPTREPDVAKRYIQDLITDDYLVELGIRLDPGSTHVFLCGNPAMIGIPDAKDATALFPQPVGVVELLTRRGFTLERRGQPGNIHVEEYW